MPFALKRSIFRLTRYFYCYSPVHQKISKYCTKQSYIITGDPRDKGDKMISEKSSGSSRNKIQIFGIRRLWPGWEAEIIFRSITLDTLCTVSKV